MDESLIKNPLVQAAVSHWNAKERIRIELPEWTPEGEELKVVYCRELNLKTLSKVVALREKGDAAESNVLALLEAVELEDGSKAFGKADQHFLKNYSDPNITGRMVQAILGQTESVDEQAEN